MLVRTIAGQQLSTRAADAIWRRLLAHFGGRPPTPSEVLAEPYTLIGVGAVAADSSAQARRLAGSGALAMLRLRRGQPGLVPTAEEAESHPYSAGEREFLDAWLSNVVLGDAGEVGAGLAELRKRTGADEMMITSNIHGHEARHRSYELIAQAYGLTG